ncbi:MAG: hypothetical protein LC798_03070 [Chloroflexi bacterium]|nr:hypothetical protein [Chloroflexota bacterium]
MTVEPILIASPTTASGAYGLTPQTVVAIPPSSLDPWANQIRVRINGVEVSRPYDPATVPA